MKLAEALLLRTELKNRLEKLKNRLQANAKVQEGDAPSEEPMALLEEFGRTALELQTMIQRINRTNSATVVGSGESLSDLLAARDVLKLRMTAYRDLAQAASTAQVRVTRSEVKFRSTVNVSEIQKVGDSLSKGYRELDGEIQRLNWLTELRD